MAGANFYNQKFVESPGSVNILHLTSVNFTNVTLNADEHVFYFNSLQQVQMDDINLLGVIPNDLNDFSTAFFTASSFDLGTTFNSSIMNLVYENSSIAALNLLKLDNSSPFIENF